MVNQIEQTLKQELDRVGVPYEIVRRGKHPQIVFTVGPQVMRYFFPSTASDCRAIANARAGVRRMLRQAGVAV